MLSDVSPGCQVLRAVGTVVMLELVGIIATIRNYLVASGALDLQLVEKILGHTGDVLETISDAAVFVRTIHCL